MKLSTLFLGCILLAASCAWAGQPPIDRILIRKAERSLQIISDGRVLHEYRISLGRQPVGPKRQQGDQRTPEGIYTIDWRHDHDSWHANRRGIPGVVLQGPGLDQRLHRPWQR